ncbi:AP-5 complex subunit beta-1 [Neosynchiropus ocellatus]
MAETLTAKVAAFSRSPARFLSVTSAEVFLAELLRELRDDRASDTIKVALLSPLHQHPALLCSLPAVGEETALELMSVFAQCPAKSLQLRSHLLLALTSVLVCTSCVDSRSQASQDFLDLLLKLAQDLHADSCLRTTACDCLREMEACCPGLLAQRLESLACLRLKETSRLHQAYAGLHTLVLRNSIYQLARESGATADHLKALLGVGSSVSWEAEQSPPPLSREDSTVLSSLVLCSTVPTLHTGPDCKELRSILSSLLEDSYLLTPVCQAALLHRLVEVVAMVPGVLPSIFRAQLLRLLGTSEVCLFHCTLLMKRVFTDSLFSAEDEAFILKRLVALSQHPLQTTPEKLFYMDCILHFPENRPISGDDLDESLPVLLTPRLASPLLPSILNDSATMLARFNLLSLVHVEEGGEGEGLVFLYEHLCALLRVVENGSSREVVATFFRAAFLFLLHFSNVDQYSSCFTEKLCALYSRHAHLAPNLINLANQTLERLPESSWGVGLLKAVQEVITQAPFSCLNKQDLRWHLMVLARVAKEADIAQHSTLLFLSSSLSFLSGDWRLGNAVLAVCRQLLIHPTLDSLLIRLADLLQHLSCSYGDTDIQDHARLYYSLVTTLSGEKLAGVLAQGLRDAGSRVKPRSLSCIMAESDGLTSALTIHQTEGPVFRLVSGHAPEPRQSEEVFPGQARSLPALESYRAQFSDPSFASEICLHYELAHIDGPTSARFQQLYSIRLHCSLTDQNYEELSDISVPCLFRKRPPPEVTLRLTPRRPFPTKLRISGIFTTEDGLSWHTVLPDVHVTFQQIFSPLPTPSPWSSSDSLSLFEELWEEICVKSGEDSDCTVSLFCCQMEPAELKTLVEKNFGAYLIRCGDREEDRVLVFLPPRSHVLLKIRPQDDAVQFSIATDDWQLLPHVNSLLTALTHPEENIPS